MLAPFLPSGRGCTRTSCAASCTTQSVHRPPTRRSTVVRPQLERLMDPARLVARTGNAAAGAARDAPPLAALKVAGGSTFSELRTGRHLIQDELNVKRVGTSSKRAPFTARRSQSGIGEVPNTRPRAASEGAFEVLRNGGWRVSAWSPSDRLARARGFAAPPPRCAGRARRP